MARSWWKIPFYVQIIVAFAAGIGLGLYLQDAAKNLAFLTTWVIWVIKTAAVPLLFLAVADAVTHADFSFRGLVRLLGLSCVNGLFAISIALVILNTFKPGMHLPLEVYKAAHPVKQTPFSELLWFDAVILFFESPMIVAIFAALLLGFLQTTLARRAAEGHWIGKVPRYISVGFKFWMKVMQGILVLIPVAVMCAVAKIVGSHGFDMFYGLSWYLLVCLAGMSLHVGLVYHGWICGYAKMHVRDFWRAAREPVANAFGVNSSLATLPLTLDALKKLHVSDTSARLSTCVGTNFNNDGILLYEVVAALFLAQAYGIELRAWQQIFAALLAVIACVGVGGIPEAGLISLTIVLSTLHLPLEGISILLAVDWFIARCRSVVNVLGDMTCAIALDGPTSHS